ncbi:MAG: LPS export ABC transporter protein LptC [Gammaproteobacteria bacterium]
MNIRFIFAALLAGIIAVFSGWFYETQSEDSIGLANSDFPVEIDYFLKKVSIRVTSQSGSLDYVLKSPYLEHLNVEDISRIQDPDVSVYRNQDNWQVNADKGELFHQINWLQLQSNARLQRLGGDLFEVTSNSLLFEPDKDLVAANEALIMRTKGAEIHAEQAVFDLKQKIYRLQKTIAIYHNDET